VISLKRLEIETTTTVNMTVLQADNQQQISIAIVGGGIAGLTLTIALLKYCPSITVTLYESASAFGEIGAGVTFSPVMVRCMSLIDPRITAAFEKCNKGTTMTDPPVWFTVRVGDERKYCPNVEIQTTSDDTGAKKEPGLGQEAFVLPARRGPGGGVHRAYFLDELIKLVPDAVVQFRKKLVNVTEATDGSGL
jgi:salicylate hydroxylase